jgi:hypothetical protein
LLLGASCLVLVASCLVLVAWCLFTYRIASRRTRLHGDISQSDVATGYHADPPWHSGMTQCSLVDIYRAG